MKATNQKRWVARSMILAPLLLSTACGGGSSTGGGSVSDSNGGGGKAGDQVNVTLEYFQQKPEVTKVIDRLIQKFTQANPHIEIKQNNVPNAQSVWQMRISTNDAPPISTQLPHDTAFRQAVANGYMADLTNEPFMKRAEANILKDGVEIDGKNYLMPIALTTLGVYYNVDMFNSLGIGIPKTYDELIQACEKIKAAGITPFLFPDKGVREVKQEAEAKLGLYVTDVNQLFTDVVKGKSHLTDHPGIRKWAEQIVEIRKYGQKDSVGLSRDDAIREFANGKSAMYFQGIWSVGPMKQNNPNLQFDMFPFPAVQAENTRVSYIIDMAMGISSTAKNPDAAKKFIDFMSLPENVQMFVDETQYPSAVTGVKNNAKEINRLSDYIDAGKTFPFVEAVFPKAQMRDDLGQAVQKLIVTKDVNGFLKELDAAFYNKANQ